MSDKPTAINEIVDALAASGLFDDLYPRFITRDPKVFGAIPVGSITDYIKSIGWTIAETVYGKWTVWISEDGEAEVIVPANSKFVDYSARVSELVSVLAQVQQRSQLEVLISIEAFNVDF